MRVVDPAVSKYVPFLRQSAGHWQVMLSLGGGCPVLPSRKSECREPVRTPVDCSLQGPSSRGGHRMFSRGARTLAREFRDGEPPGPLSCRKSGWLAWPTAACCAPPIRSAATRTRSSALTATTARRVLRSLLDAGETGAVPGQPVQPGLAEHERPVWERVQPSHGGRVRNRQRFGPDEPDEQPPVAHGHVFLTRGPKQARQRRNHLGHAAGNGAEGKVDVELSRSAAEAGR